MARISKDTKVSIVWTVEREYGFTGPVSNLTPELAQVLVGQDDSNLFELLYDGTNTDQLAFDHMINQAEINDESVSLVETEVVTS